MGLGKQKPDGTHEPITPWKGSWAETVNQPIPAHVKKAHQDQYAATHSGRIVIGQMTMAQYRRYKGLD